MASLQLKPPVAFHFSKPEEWKKWKSRFEQFRLASGLSKASEERQVSSLLYCMGEDAADVLDTTDISGDMSRHRWSPHNWSGRTIYGKNFVAIDGPVGSSMAAVDGPAGPVVAGDHLRRDRQQEEIRPSDKQVR